VTERAEVVRPLQVLLPVWGDRHVRQFLELSLPTWLAVGNLPAVAAHTAAELVIMTGAADWRVIERHPGLARVRTVLPVRVMLIDDLIVPRNHSTVLTLAWERAIRAAGDDLTETCFIMLVSDVLLPESTLGSVVDRLLAGHRGVMIGGLQVVLDEVAAELRAKIDRNDGVCGLAARALVRWSLAHLHPTLAAAFVDQGLSHSTHPNHLFWRIDEASVLARYFCMYMIGVRPERRQFEISAPLDFSFQPEMCPSGDVVVLDDSDQGFFVECLPRHHEAAFLAPGPYDVAAIAASLGRWTTAEQRRLSMTRVLFHAGEPCSVDHPVYRASEVLLEDIRARMPAQAQPHRGHPYWGPQLNAFLLERGRDAEPALPGAPAGIPARAHGLRRLLWRLAGRPPTVRRWHPFWRDYGPPCEAARTEWLGTRKRIVVLCDGAHPLARWLAFEHAETVLRPLRDSEAAPDSDGCDGALVLASAPHLAELSGVLDRLARQLTAGGLALLHIDDVAPAPGRPLELAVLGHAGMFRRPPLNLESCVYVGGRIHRLALDLYAAGARLYTRGGALRTALAAVLSALSMVLGLWDSCAGRGRRGSVRSCSSITLAIRSEPR